jgi:hypothetical protein
MSSSRSTIGGTRCSRLKYALISLTAERAQPRQQRRFPSIAAELPHRPAKRCLHDFLGRLGVVAHPRHRKSEERREVRFEELPERCFAPAHHARRQREIGMFHHQISQSPH